MSRSLSVAMIATLSAVASAEPSSVVEKTVMVYYEPGRFGGWPANHGIWSWGNEILVGFSRGYYMNLGDERHNIDRDKPEEHCLARSLDGGETWTIEHPNEKGFLLPQGAGLHGTELPGVPLKEAVDLEEPIDFTHPDLAVTFRMNDHHKGPSRLYYSYDRGKTWEGPFTMPDFGTPGTAARTNYVIDSKRQMTAFLTVAKPDGREGRSLCARTTDGGVTWTMLGWIGPEPAGYSIMPSGVRISANELYVITRWREPNNGPSGTSGYRSTDDGKTWEHVVDPSPTLGEGNPASLIRLKDGRLCYTYGFRAVPFRMAAKLSADNGTTWSEEIVLRDDGGNRDLGYPRSVERPDGKVVTTYYFWDKKTGPERYIAATIWDPAKVK